MKAESEIDSLKSGDLAIIDNGVFLGRLPENGILKSGQHYQSIYIKPGTLVFIIELTQLIRESTGSRFDVVKVMANGTIGWLYPSEI